LLLIFSFFIISLHVTSVHAAKYNYTLMESIPGFSDSADFPTYVLNVYKFGIWSVGIAAMLMITIGGFMYMTSAGNTASAGTAKKVITDALFGLAMAVLAYTILYIINPDLVSVNLKFTATQVTPAAGKPPVAQEGPTTTAAPGGQTGSCNGFSVSGISDSQCKYASSGLSNILACMKAEGITAPINSVSDSHGFEECKNNWSKAACAHAATSCHYGGGAGKTDPDCQKSHAADFSTRTGEGPKIIAAANKCGGRVNDETAKANHIHVSDNTPCCNL
jgi:hypothetical protein